MISFEVSVLQGVFFPLQRRAGLQQLAGIQKINQSIHQSIRKPFGGKGRGGGREESGVISSFSKSSKRTSIFRRWRYHFVRASAQASIDCLKKTIFRDNYHIRPPPPSSHNRRPSVLLLLKKHTHTHARAHTTPTPTPPHPHPHTHHTHTQCVSFFFRDFFFWGKMHSHQERPT